MDGRFRWDVMVFYDALMMGDANDQIIMPITRIERTYDVLALLHLCAKCDSKISFFSRFYFIFSILSFGLVLWEC